jgi:hypothetical protein
MILVDICAMSCVFEETNKEHSKFHPIFCCLNNGNGVLVYGGKKYNNELKKAKSYLRYVAHLERASKVFHCDDKKVDSMMEWVVKQETDPDFDDPHLIAISIVAKNTIICTNDKRAIRFIKKKTLYPKYFTVPPIYTNNQRNNAKLKSLAC